MKTSIYLPDELAEQVRAHGISISEVTQTALRKAVHAAIIEENKDMTDISTVAERLRGTISDKAKTTYEGGQEHGRVWARKYATADELEQMASYDGSGSDFQRPHTLVEFLSERDDVAYVSIKMDTEDPYWDGFIQGAGEVWDAVQPLLNE